MKALFTSVPVELFIQIVQQMLIQDTTLPQRTNMPIPQIIKLLKFCLKHTYFFFQGRCYEQVHDAAMVSPIIPIIANLFMEEFEVKALNTASTHAYLCLRFVDNTFVIQKAEHSQQCLQWKNQINLSLFHSWTQRSHQGPTTHSAPQYIGNQNTKTNIYIGTEITS